MESVEDSGARTSSEATALDVIEMHVFIFERNYQEFAAMYRRINHPDNVFHLWDDRLKLEWIITEAARLFQNFATAAQALVESSSIVLARLYRGTELGDELRREHARRIDDYPLYHLVRELSRYSLHHRVPLRTTRLQMAVDGVDALRVVIAKAPLLEWQGWHAAAQFLHTLPDPIPLEKIIDPLFERIQEYHRWTTARLRHELAVRVGPPPPPWEEERA